MPRWHILRTLLAKEAHRHLANRGGLVLLLMLVVASLLLSFFRGSSASAGGLTGGVQRCYIDYWETGPLVEHLRRHVPTELAEHIVFRPAFAAPTDPHGTLVYPQGTGAIQLRPLLATGPASRPGSGTPAKTVRPWLSMRRGSGKKPSSISSRRRKPYRSAATMARPMLCCRRSNRSTRR